MTKTRSSQKVYKIQALGLSFYLLNSTDIHGFLQITTLVSEPWLLCAAFSGQGPLALCLQPLCSEHTLSAREQGTLHLPSPWNRGSGLPPSPGRFSEVRGWPEEPPSRLCCGWSLKREPRSRSPAECSVPSPGRAPAARPDPPASELREHRALGGGGAHPGLRTGPRPHARV